MGNIAAQVCFELEIAQVGPAKMLRSVLLLSLACGHEGWWWTNSTEEDRPPDPYRAWINERFPTDLAYYDSAKDSLRVAGSTMGSFAEQSSERGIWLLCDGVVGLVGWGLFGSAWADVRTGCRRMVQVAILVAICIVAHYLWAFCWPVISLIIATVMAVTWVARKMMRIVGSVVFRLQRALGGTPESVDAEYFGPGTGSLPETSELRRFKYASGSDKWVVLKRDKDVVVFKVGSETQTIRSSGMYVGIEVDTLRGSPSLLGELQGFDKVHLCRNHTCGEDGQHFKTYGLAKQFNPERFQLQLAAAGAKDAGQTMWSWIWKGSQKVGHKLADFGSESEAENLVCPAYKIRWSSSQGEELLSDRPCKCGATEHVALLIEDQYGPDDSVVLCPTHASKYLSKRMSEKCSMTGCRRIGCNSNGGIRVCAHHEAEQHAPSARASRSRSREKRPSFQQEDGGARGAETEDEGDKGRVRGGEMQTLLDEIRELKSAIPPKETADEGGKRRRLSSRSPGTTPKSSVHRSLAKLGMLDSPDVEDKPNWLEEFFERYMDGKALNIGEDQVRKGMCEKYGVSTAEMARSLHGLASLEQSKGSERFDQVSEQVEGGF